MAANYSTIEQALEELRAGHLIIKHLRLWSIADLALVEGADTAKLAIKAAPKSKFVFIFLFDLNS